MPILLVVSLAEKMNISLFPFALENLVSRDGFGSSPVPRQPAHLHTQAEPGAYLRDSSRFPRRRPFIELNQPYGIGPVPSLSDHAIVYRWRSRPRVRRHSASKPPGSSKRVLPWQVTMEYLICASLSHTHCWYEVGIMLKVPTKCVVYKYLPYICVLRTGTLRYTNSILVLHTISHSSSNNSIHSIATPCKSCQRCRPSWDLRPEGTLHERETNRDLSRAPRHVDASRDALLTIGYFFCLCCTRIMLYILFFSSVRNGVGRGGALPDFSFVFFPRSADRQRDRSPPKVVFWSWQPTR